MGTSEEKDILERILNIRMLVAHLLFVCSIYSILRKDAQRLKISIITDI